MAKVEYHAVGRRKTAIARVRLVAGDGKILINKRGLDDYFGLETLKMTVRQPLELTKAGGDMVDGVRINGVRHGRPYTLTPDFHGGSVAFNDAKKDESAAEREERMWIDSIRNNTNPVTLPEQAYCVTRILEGIYTSAKTGEIYRF